VLPRLLLPNKRVFSPLEGCLGTSPKNAEKRRPFLKFSQQRHAI